MNNNCKKKILIVTTRFPWPAIGASERDRSQGIKDFIRYGYNIRVVTKIFSFQKKEIIDQIKQKFGIKIYPVLYKYDQLNKKQKIICLIKRLLCPVYLDGAAFEYKDKEINKVLLEQLEQFKPDLVYFDTTILWPLYKIVKQKRIPIITRSHNFEPLHFLEENGYNFLNYFKFIFKLLSEYLTVKKTDVIFSISPKELKLYKRIGAKYITNLPLRELPKYFDFNYETKNREILNIFFMGSTYSVFHNRKALKFLIKDVAPLVFKKFPGKFKFNILGTKFPENFRKYLGEDIIFRGFIEDENIDNFLLDMDIAVIPSICGGGMQQKLFEPLVRGFPLVTQKHGLAGYSFNNGKELLLAKTAQEFADCIGKFVDFNYRKKISKQAKIKSRELFSQKNIDQTIKKAVNYIDNLKL